MRRIYALSTLLLFVKVLYERGICPVNLEIYSVSKAKYNVRYKKWVMIIYERYTLCKMSKGRKTLCLLTYFSKMSCKSLFGLLLFLS